MVTAVSEISSQGSLFWFHIHKPVVGHSFHRAGG
ncbi:unnamed protein product [Brassica oleracea var. botrytis]|uniref:Uncharacterized protein n=1 Tax=Brassica campestris TaxID=3711 RepID=A0A3P6CR02_BRACM|nr:unnamed protein product [Brassica rapa]CAG7906612.1 unnamed protein product [Brassica rapa]VDC62848.1 unnamed protein product [Brassica rapa]VDD12591.1 unnamed protein product [Brassica rapa]